MSKPHNGPRILGNFEDYVDTAVIKRSGKPFKSGLLKGTVRSVGVNQYTGKPGFFFYEDDSVVDCHFCKADQPE